MFTGHRHSLTDELICPHALGLTRFHHSGQGHFVTFCCYHRRRLFTTEVSRRIFESALERVRRGYRLYVYGYVVMPEHVHLLLSAPRTGSGAVFATTQPAVRDESRSSRNGQHENAKERQENFVQPSNWPTQANPRLEWATSPLCLPWFSS